MGSDAGEKLVREGQRREAAVSDLVEKVSRDRHIIACFIYGSTVRGDFWFNSDIDVILVTTDETVTGEQRVLEEGGCWFETFLVSRRKFRQMCEGTVSSVGPSSMRHSGRLVYCSDSSLREYFAEDGRLGAYEMMCKVFIAGAWCHFYFQKIEKYCGRGQNERAYNMLTCLIDHFAAVVILQHGQTPERERVEQAMQVAPELFAPYPAVIYGAMPGIEYIAVVMDRIKHHIYEHTEEIFQLLLDYMRDEGRELPISTIHDRFAQVLRAGDNNDLVYGACEMLCEVGILERGEYEVRLTKKSVTTFSEPAYSYIAAEGTV
jgi:uncharacterized protein